MSIASDIKITPLHCGRVGVDPAVPFRDVSRNPLAYTGLFRSGKLRIWLPVIAYLVEHPKGLVLFDTAWHTDVRKRPVKHESFPLWFASKPELPPGQAISEHLRALGYTPDDVDHVILSHMDVDHVSGLALVREAQHIWASSEELVAARGRNARYCNKKLWKDIPIVPIPFQHDDIAPYGRSWDVFGDGTIKALFMPGHSAGSVVLEIQNNGRFAFLVGDTGYAKSSWEDHRLPGPVFSQRDLLRSLAWVDEASKQESCEAVLACHDPAVTADAITL